MPANVTVVAHAQLARTRLPTTGMGKYVINSILGLAATPGIDLEMFCSREYRGPDGRLDDRTPLHVLRARTYPAGERLMERSWKLLGLPGADRWIGPADWVFVPTEVPVPTKRRSVMCIHDAREVEPTLPWVDPKEQRRVRRRNLWWLGPAVRRADRIATVSEYSKGRIVELFGIPPEKVFVCYNGVEQAFYDAADRDPAACARPVPGPYLLTIGGMHRAKAINDLIGLADELARRRSPVTIVTVGQQDPVAVERVGGRPNVVALGKVSDDRLAEYVRAALAVVTFSLLEGFGIPAAEAMAAGTPSIVSDNTALPEVVGDGGIVLDSTRSGEAADVVDRLAADPAYRDDRVRKGRARAAMFTWDRSVARVAAVLKA